MRASADIESMTSSGPVGAERAWAEINTVSRMSYERKTWGPAVKLFMKRIESTSSVFANLITIGAAAGSRRLSPLPRQCC
jgi:hypothetical protein